MVAQVYLVKVDNPEDPVKTLIDGIHVVLTNADDGDSEATIIAEVVATANANGIPLPDGYFDTAEQFNTTAGFDADEDAMFVAHRRRVDVIA